MVMRWAEGSPTFPSQHHCDKVLCAAVTEEEELFGVCLIAAGEEGEDVRAPPLMRISARCLSTFNGWPYEGETTGVVLLYVVIVQAIRRRRSGGTWRTTPGWCIQQRWLAPPPTPTR
ncbi:hypothetical protein AGDE_14926 [Angomonas deanei]|uniref:Uncharacterized protein n=1 Tax=Angomonas deanei TaxID=59799 RepID=A0A7G2CLJ5_9TRYP|nr:hypothetical protein AGDE_14926 [Angomonas deanei]CAD2220728.1 hypothetical protein, conserved [Angomonas deanei]|eukprot:EPY19987.1 hypothetical protein AGDE_14926 [Angomonas deanei]